MPQKERQFKCQKARLVAHYFRIISAPQELSQQVILGFFIIFLGLVL